MNAEGCCCFAGVNVGVNIRVPEKVKHNAGMIVLNFYVELFLGLYHIDVIYLQYSSILRWITPPTFNCSLYCIIIIGLMLRLRAKRTVSMSDSLHKMMPIVGFSLDLRSSWSSGSR